MFSLVFMIFTRFTFCAFHMGVSLLDYQFNFLDHKDSDNAITAQKMQFSIKDFFSKWDQIRSFLGIWSHLLKKFLMENFIFCAVYEIMSFVFQWAAITLASKGFFNHPVDTRRRFNVSKTSIRRGRRRIDDLWTLKRRRVYWARCFARYPAVRSCYSIGRNYYFYHARLPTLWLTL